jgi:CRP-like cAMP-binding protein
MQHCMWKASPGRLSTSFFPFCERLEIMYRYTIFMGVVTSGKGLIFAIQTKRHLMSELLRKYVNQFIKLTDEEFDRFCAPFELVIVRRKEMVLKEGAYCRFEGFVTQGCFRVYFLDDNGVEQILQFATETWWITDIDSFTNKLPAKLNIEALEDSEVLMISYDEKEKLYEALPKVEQLFRMMNQRAMVALQRRIYALQSMTADKRYLQFLEKYPELEQRLNQQQIAAYLGISHEFLSKIRKKLSQKN